VRRSDDRALKGEVTIERDIVVGVGLAIGFGDRRCECLHRIAHLLRDPEVEELRKEQARSREHHDVHGFEVAVHDAAFVCALHDFADPLEQGHEALERERTGAAQHAIERRASHELHRDPEKPVGLGAKGVDVRGVRMIETGRELRLAEEPVDDPCVRAVAVTQHLDHGVSAKEALLGAIHSTEATFADLLFHHEVAEPTTGEGVGARVRGARALGQSSATAPRRTRKSSIVDHACAGQPRG